MTICNCNQGRLPCTCRRTGMPPELAAPYGQPGGDLYAQIAQNLKNRPGYWERLATEKAKLFSIKCAEVDVLTVRLRVYQGVATIGWAAAILLALGV